MSRQAEADSRRAMSRNLVIPSTGDKSLIERRLFDVASKRGVDLADLMFDLAGQNACTICRRARIA